MARRRNTEEENPINFFWIRYIGVNRLGFSHREAGQQYFGYWCDLFEQFKKQYNFEKKRTLYNILEEEPISSLSVL